MQTWSQLYSVIGGSAIQVRIPIRARPEKPDAKSLGVCRKPRLCPLNLPPHRGKSLH